VDNVNLARSTQIVNLARSRKSCVLERQSGTQVRAEKQRQLSTQVRAKSVNLARR
jgi:hypothetical protein